VKLRRAALGLALVVVAATIVPILALRWIPPLTTSFMLAQRWPFTRGDAACAAIEYDWTPRRAISQNVFRAVVAAEDQRFADHGGFDFDAIEDALEDAGAGSPARGASTISQQVAKNLFLWKDRSFARKGLEAWLTLWIEALWPKERILEVYVNVAQFGRCTFGVAAASRRFFDRQPADLTASQAALLAAVLPNPVERRVDAPSGRVRSRAAWIARQAARVELPPPP
jgi:monofunctional biosynthetic peptidoglycan transglycosylase